MEPHPGVFLSNVRTKEWAPDPEVPGSEMHELAHAPNRSLLGHHTARSTSMPWSSLSVRSPVTRVFDLRVF